MAMTDRIFGLVVILVGARVYRERHCSIQTSFLSDPVGLQDPSR